MEVSNENKHGFESERSEICTYLSYLYYYQDPGSMEIHTYVQIRDTMYDIVTTTSGLLSGEMRQAR